MTPHHYSFFLTLYLRLFLPLPSTSTDRYANVDVGVLLYHIERFPGIIILTTNLIDNIDKAFFRRLRFVLPLDAPPRNLRARLWKVCCLLARVNDSTYGVSLKTN